MDEEKLMWLYPHSYDEEKTSEDMRVSTMAEPSTIQSDPFFDEDFHMENPCELQVAL